MYLTPFAYNRFTCTIINQLKIVINFFQVLKDVILDMYRVLKLLTDNTEYPLLAAQASLALNELDNVTTEFLKPTETLEKKIYVTELPPKEF